MGNPFNIQISFGLKENAVKQCMTLLTGDYLHAQKT
jgi:hypothetical protein